MRRKSIAIAASYKDPLTLAMESAQNLLMLLADKMYGTPERVRVTYGCAVLLTVIAMILTSGSAHALPVCAI